MENKIIEIANIRRGKEAKADCLNQLGKIPFYIKPGGEVLTKSEHQERQRKKQEIERNGKDRI